MSNSHLAYSGFDSKPDPPVNSRMLPNPLVDSKGLFDRPRAQRPPQPVGFARGFARKTPWPFPSGLVYGADGQLLRLSLTRILCNPWRMSFPKRTAELKTFSDLLESGE